MEEYKILLDLIHKYIDLKLWQYIDGCDIFELQLSSKNVFISILGMANIDHGIVVYENLSDLSSQVMCENDNMGIEQPDTPFRFSCLKIDCFDGRLISEYDSSRRIFEYDIEDDAIAVKYSIGKPMRLVNKEESLLLIEVLETLIQNETMIKTLDFEKIKGTETYSLRKSNGRYISEVISFPALKPLEYSFLQEINLDLFDRVDQYQMKHEWAIGIFYSPVYVDDEQPYFPKICVIYDITTNTILDVIAPYYDDYEYFPELFLESLEKIGYLPEYLYLANFETVCCLAKILDSLDIDGEVKMIEELNMVYDDLGNELVKDIEKNEVIS